MNAHFIAFWTQGQWTQVPKFPILSVTQDSRQAKAGSLYVALKGARHDGHDFLQMAFDQGATAAIVDRTFVVPEALQTVPLLRVTDPRQALQHLAAGWRNSLNTFVIGVTGSAGKTTVKELTAAFCSVAGKTQCTPGNYNNDVGLPLTLLALEPDTKFAVVEAGISHPYDMFPLAHAMRPQAAIITSIGPAHIEFFGSEDAIAAEKGQLLQSLPEYGFAVLCKETHCFETLVNDCPARVVTTSLKDPTADYYGEPLAKGVVRVLHHDEAAVLLETGLAGEHNASNAVLAYAAAREVGISPDTILAGLANFKPPAMRWQVEQLGDIQVINDAYNANPLSMRAALETFAGTNVAGEKVACVGDMMELGEASEVEHHQCGFLSGNGPWRLLIGIGPHSRALLEGAKEAGYPASHLCYFETTDAALEEIKLLLHPGDTLLLKGSRGMHLERLCDAFRPTLDD